MSAPHSARLRTLLHERSVRWGPVTLASGAKSDWFVDCKQTVLTAEGHALVGELCFDALLTLTPRPLAVAGVALGGCPLASAVAQRSFASPAPMDAVYVRKELKAHGSGRRIEGDDSLPDRAPIAILEDVVTTGESTLRALDALRKRPFDVVAVWALVDRLEGGAARIQAEGVAFLAAFTRKDFESP